MAARLADAVPPMLVTHLVGPQVARIGEERVDDIVRRVGLQLVGEGGDDPPPLVRRPAEADRIVSSRSNRMAVGRVVIIPT